jgi:hypothetical protein
VLAGAYSRGVRTRAEVIVRVRDRDAWDRA